jgi:hypothetical protein
MNIEDVLQWNISKGYGTSWKHTGLEVIYLGLGGKLYYGYAKHCEPESVVCTKEAFENYVKSAERPRYTYDGYAVTLLVPEPDSEGDIPIQFAESGCFSLVQFTDLDRVTKTMTRAEAEEELNVIILD